MPCVLPCAASSAYHHRSLSPGGPPGRPGPRVRSAYPQLCNVGGECRPCRPAGRSGNRAAYPRALLGAFVLSGRAAGATKGEPRPLRRQHGDDTWLDQHVLQTHDLWHVVCKLLGSDPLHRYLEGTAAGDLNVGYTALSWGAAGAMPRPSGSSHRFSICSATMCWSFRRIGPPMPRSPAITSTNIDIGKLQPASGSTALPRDRAAEALHLPFQLIT